MPNIKSAIKRVEISQIQNARNRAVKSEIKSAVKKYEAAVAAQDENVNELLRHTTSLIDKAAARNTIHKNAANRKKARLTKLAVQ